MPWNPPESIGWACTESIQHLFCRLLGVLLVLAVLVARLSEEKAATLMS